MSPKSASTGAVLRAVSEQTLGFSFGPPDRPSDSALACLLPILRETSRQRQYVTYAETDRVLVSDSGAINRLNVKNAGTENVYLRSGTMFEGKGTQSRALTRSAVIFPGQEVALDVRCIHQSHGIRSGSTFSYGGVTPIDLDRTFYGPGYRPADQMTMWNSVQSYAATVTESSHATWVGEGKPKPLPRRQGGRPLMRRERIMPTASAAPSRGLTSSFNSPNSYTVGATNLRTGESGEFGVRGEVGERGERGPLGAGPADNLLNQTAAFAQNFDAVLSKARLHDNQAGIALITDKGCQTVELFDVPASWEALHKDAVKRMGTELLRGPDQANVFEYKPERAAEAVRAVLGLPWTQDLIWEHKPSNGEPHVGIYGLTASGYVGEAVEIAGEVAHLVLLQTAGR